jgi:glycosyltransferase involved in cell wall biosynthesis
MASVDVVVPSFQYGRYLADCVASILGQEGVDVRVLIVDNASTDGSADIARDLAHRDGRVEVVARSRNLGPHASFNAGVAWAAADYFLILCADDLLAPGALARAAGVMDRHPDVHLSFGRATAIGPDDPLPSSLGDAGEAEWRVMSGDALLRRFCGTGRNPLPGPTCVVRTSVQKAAGIYRPELTHTDDMELWMRFTCHGGAAETDAVQAFQRVHGHNQSATVADIQLWNLQFEAAFESFFSREGAALPNTRAYRDMARRSLGERAYWSAFAHLARGEGKTALALAKFAIRLAPSTLALPPLGYLLRRRQGAGGRWSGLEAGEPRPS